MDLYFNFKNRPFHFVFFAFLLFLLSSSLLLAADDVIVLKNGDRISGEIKKLVNGVLHVDPPYGENIFMIDWEEVDHIEGNNQFITQASDGTYVTGKFKSDTQQKGQILVDDGTQTLQLAQSELVFLKPVDEGFWGRFGASIDLGLSITKADDTRQLNSRATADYLTDRWEAAATFDTLLNKRKKVEDTRRTEVTGDYRYTISGRWFSLANARFLQSDELELNLRSTIGGGFGNYLVRNNRWTFSALGGLAWTNENFKDPTLEDANNAEAFTGVELNAFDIGAVDIISSFSLIPSLTDSGRYRFNFRTDFKWEIFNDFFFRVGFSDDYDNRPVGDAPNNDYVFSTSVGWSY
jgi:putative salt-induced outer membrane protein YdiY